MTVGAASRRALLGSRPTGRDGGTIRALAALTLPEPRARLAALAGALGIALMSFTETMAAGRAFAQSGEPALRPNRELLATGIATAAGGLLGACRRRRHVPDAVNRSAGARSQLAGLVTGAATLLTLLFSRP